MADAKMKGAILFQGQMFTPEGGPGDVRRLSAVATDEDLARWSKAELIEGDWTSTKGTDQALVGGLDNTPQGVTASGSPRSGDEELLEIEAKGAAATGTKLIENDAGQPAGSDAGTPLPDGFPARMQLMKAGFVTVEKVDAASDADLIALPEVGEATVKKIREAIT